MPVNVSACGLRPAIDWRNHSILSDQRLENHTRSFPISLVQQRAFARLIQRLSHGEPVTTLALGGSAIYGTDCHELGTPRRECSFPGRFVRGLQRAYCNNKLTFLNHASGGQGTVASLPQLPSLLALHSYMPTDATGQPAAMPDLVIIDFSVNDVTQSTYVRGDETQRRAGPAAVEAGTEVMLRWMLDESSFGSQPPALLMVDQECRTCTVVREACQAYNDKSREGILEAHRRVAFAFGVPYVAYRDLLRDEVSTHGSCGRTAFGMPPGRGSAIHPGASTHQLTADALAAFWWRGLVPAVATPLAEIADRRNLTWSPHGPHLTSEKLRSRLGVCPKPLCSYDAQAIYGGGRSASSAGCGSLDNVTVVRGNWTLFEDRPGKAGWISDGPAASTLEFVVAFGVAPRITLVVEQGYEGFGAVEVSFVGRQGSHRTPMRVDGSRSDGLQITTAEVVALNVQQVPAVTPGFAMPSFARNERMRLTLMHTRHISGKFKVRHVSSC